MAKKKKKKKNITLAVSTATLTKENTTLPQPKLPILPKIDPELAKYNRTKYEIKKFANKAVELQATLERAPMGSIQWKNAAEAIAKNKKKIAQLESSVAGVDLVNARNGLSAAYKTGDQDVIKAAEQAVSDAQAKASGSPVVANNVSIPGDIFGNALRNSSLGVSFDGRSNTLVKNDGKGPNKAYIYQDDKGALNTTYNFQQAKDSVLKNYYSNHNEEVLWNLLWNNHSIKRETYNSRNTNANDFTQALESLINGYGMSIITSYQVAEAKGMSPQEIYNNITKADKIPDFSTFLQNNAANILGGTGSRPSSDMVLTLRQDAERDLNMFFADWLGRPATKEEQNKYYKLIRNAESKARRTSTTDASGNTVTSGQLLTDYDYLEMQREVAGRALAGSDLDTVLNNGAAGAQLANEVLSYAKNYGVAMTPREALGYVAQELKNNQQDVKATKAKLLKISQSTYSNLADTINDEVSLRDLSTNYIYEMGKTLEVNTTDIDPSDSTIQAALRNNGQKGTMSLGDFRVMLRNDPRWAKTQNAREEASNYAIDILKSFGLMA